MVIRAAALIFIQMLVIGIVAALCLSHIKACSRISLVGLAPYRTCQDDWSELFARLGHPVSRSSALEVMVLSFVLGVAASAVVARFRVPSQLNRSVAVSWVSVSCGLFCAVFLSMPFAKVFESFSVLPTRYASVLWAEVYIFFFVLLCSYPLSTIFQRKSSVNSCENECVCCAYDVRNLSGSKCPECGATLGATQTTLVPRFSLLSNLSGWIVRSARLGSYLSIPLTFFIVCVLCISSLATIGDMVRSVSSFREKNVNTQPYFYWSPLTELIVQDQYGRVFQLRFLDASPAFVVFPSNGVSGRDSNTIDFLPKSGRVLQLKKADGSVDTMIAWPEPSDTEFCFSFSDELQVRLDRSVSWHPTIGVSLDFKSSHGQVRVFAR